MSDDLEGQQDGGSSAGVEGGVVKCLNMFADRNETEMKKDSKGRA